MARLTPPDNPSTDADTGTKTQERVGRLGLEDGRGDRAQLILIAGFVIAVSLVGLALIINAAIFTENLATRSDTSGAVDALSYRSATERGLGKMLVFENDQHPDDPATAENHMEQAVAEYSELSTRQQAPEGRVVDVSHASNHRGSHLFQNGPRIFRSGDSDSTSTVWSQSERNWSLANGVSNTRQFRIAISDRSNLSEFRTDEPDFKVLVNKSTYSGTQGWWLNVTDSGGLGSEVVVTVSDNSNEVSKCRRNVGNDFWINVTAGTVAGAECQGLEFGEGISGTYDIYYLNSSNAKGNYSLVVDDTNPPIGAYDPSGEDPREEDTLYSVTADLVYRTSDLNYTTAVRVAPGEPDE